MPQFGEEKLYNVMFWNCHKKNNDADFQIFLKDLLNDEKIDLFCLAECLDFSQIQLADFLKNISSNGRFYRHIGRSDKKHDLWMNVFSSLPDKDDTAVQIKKKSSRYINVWLYKTVEIVFVHLKSLFSADMETKLEDDKDVLADVYKGCIAPKFFIGDFNATPYSSALLNSRTFNSIRLGEGAVKGSRREMSNHRRRINPSWNVYGKASSNYSEPLGSFFHKASTLSNIGWELLDQVVFDEQLECFYKENSFRILSFNSKSIKLTTIKGRINETYSDHLPVAFSLKDI